MRNVSEPVAECEIPAQAAVPEFEPAVPPRARRALSAILIVLALVLTPVAITASWATTQLARTDAFVAQLAPLATHPAIRAFLIDEVSTALAESIDLEQAAGDVIAGLLGLDLPPRAARALGGLQGPAVEAAKGIIRNGVAQAVESDAFASAWESGLRVAHRQVIGALAGDGGTALNIASNGELTLDLGPIVAEVRTRLLDQGVSFAAGIPPIEAKLLLASSDQLAAASLGYSVLNGLGAWLPVLVLGLLGAGVALARRRARAGLTAGVWLAVVSLTFGVALWATQLAVVAALSPNPVPRDVAVVLVSALTVGLRQPVQLAVTLGVVIALAGYLSGPFRGAATLRELTANGMAAVRAVAERNGLSTGRFGVALNRWRMLWLTLVPFVALVFLAFLRPLSGAVLAGVVLIAVVLLLLLQLLSRPDVVGAAVGSGEDGDRADAVPVGRPSAAGSD